MRRLVAAAGALALATISGGAAAQVPATVSFTARLADGGAPATGSHDFQFRLLDASGAQLWAETQPGGQVADGMAYLELGSATPLDASVFGGAQLWLEVTVDSNVLAPKLPVESVPYAIRAGVAQSADKLGSFAPGDFVTGVTAGAGLAGGGAGGSVSLAVDADKVQSRVSAACSAGWAIRQVNADGSVVCEELSSTSYAAGAGLSLTGTTFATNAATCAPGFYSYWDGAAWLCRGDRDEDTTYLAGAGLDLAGSTFATKAATCAEGSCSAWDGAAWQCRTDKDTTYSAGDGLAQSGTTFAVKAPACAAGEHSSWSGAAWQCRADKDTTYSAGDGLAQSGTTFAIKAPACAAGEHSSWSGAAWQCRADKDTTYVAGAGLTLGGATFQVAFAGTGVATTAARSDHTTAWSTLTAVPAGFADGTDNDTTYAAGAGLTLGGATFQVAFAGTGVATTAARSDHTTAWSTLTAVPAGFADGTDNDTTYTAGAGLTLSGSQFSASFAGSGVASSAARSDHTHTPACPAGAAYSYTYGSVTTCVYATSGAGVWGQRAAACATSYNGADLCSVSQMAVAMSSGFSPTVGYWLRDRLTDDHAAYVNNAGDFTNLDGDGLANSDFRGAYCCLVRQSL